ncbi:right handed beta helix region [Terrimicrobium sacchariphilum]|uniref:Right handed beta helix region n=1 Tax=Terrimicrobium sacchariphilum TaxID=690879 RepID=A0A146G5I6_TERSA|nr:right-handed parallel beta-helix repeat-containing protein [Terrimicrobium sacchariphilum]GAT33045.1 right handed beta helix region [Terrimicrobium sacchariphilum]
MKKSFLPFVTAFCLGATAVHSSDDFRPALEQAVKSGAHEFTIPAGTYHLKPVGGDNNHVTVNNAKDLTINAEGVKLICGDMTRAVTIKNSRNVTLKGLTIDYDPLPYTQGDIIATAPDDSWVDVRIHAGYPRKPYSRIDVIDPATRFRKRGMPFLWGAKGEMRGEDVVRVYVKDIGKIAKVGDMASMSGGPRPGGVAHAVAIENCAGTVFEGVSVFSAPGFGIIEQDGDGGMRYTRCKVVPGPKPEGATQERLLSSVWDAMQSKTMKRGPLVEQCEIRDAGDDSWSVQSSDFMVVAVDGSTATLTFRDEHCLGPQVGDSLATSLDGKTAEIIAKEYVKLPDDLARKVTEAPQWTLWRTNTKAVKVTVKGDVPFLVGESVYCPDRQGNGFIFRNNITRSSGRILIKAGDGMIEGNQIFDGHSGVTVSPEVPGEAAAGIRNLVIRNNTFKGTGYFCPSWSTDQAGCISIAAGAKYPVFQNIRIEGNRFEDFNGPGIVLFAAKGVSIRDNLFARVMTAPPSVTGAGKGVNGESLLWLTRSSDITTSGNKVYEPGAYLKATVSGKDVAQDTLDKLAEGFSIETAPSPFNLTQPSH